MALYYSNYLLGLGDCARVGAQGRSGELRTSRSPALGNGTTQPPMSFLLMRLYKHMCACMYTSEKSTDTRNAETTKR